MLIPPASRARILSSLSPLATAARSIRRLSAFSSSHRPMLMHLRPSFNSQLSRNQFPGNQGGLPKVELAPLFTMRTSSLKSRTARVFTPIGLGIVSLFVGASLWTYIDPPFYFFWPEELHKDLEAGTQSRNSGNYKDAVVHFNRSLNIIESLPSEKLSPEPISKILRVLILLADALEGDNRPGDAYVVLDYALALYLRYQSHTRAPTLPIGSSTGMPIDIVKSINPSEPVQRSNETGYIPSEDERRFAIAISLKILDLADHANVDEEIKFSHAATGYMNAVYLAGASGINVPGSGINFQPADEPTLPTLSKDVRYFRYPAWACLTNMECVVSATERMGLICEKRGFFSAAISLYTLAIRIYDTERWSVEDGCRLLRIYNGMLRLHMLAVLENGKGGELKDMQQMAEFLETGEKIIDMLNQKALNGGISGGMFSVDGFTKEVVQFYLNFGKYLLINEPEQSLLMFSAGLEIARAHSLEKEQKAAESALESARNNLPTARRVVHAVD